MNQRTSGILLHISSLPSDFGIGDFGRGAYQFVDFLHESKQGYWQILPLNPTDFFTQNSPYSSHSAFAGNTLFISPEGLVDDGILTMADLAGGPVFPTGKVDYALTAAYKNALLDLSYKRFKEKKIDDGRFKKFLMEHSYWLDDYALFMAIKEKFGGEVWSRWPKGFKTREGIVLKNFQIENVERLERIKFFQYLFFEQWRKLKDYGHQKGIQIIGDIPIYVNFDSADVWKNPEIFKLNSRQRPIVVAGVPPDYFSKTGQRWGNPVYRWERLQETKFSWWIQRLSHNLRLFDIVRIDHFRGLIASWEIPFYNKTAVHGEWGQCPWDDFFVALKNEFPHLPFIAEDLGMITPDVKEVMRHYELPGMKVLLFAFDGDMKTNPYIPESYEENCVVYTGTHDNNTVRGWFQKEACEEAKSNLFQYLRRTISQEEIHWVFVELAMKSLANLAIIPMQDILGLGEEARMNKPATFTGNWQWRLDPGAFKPSICQKLSFLTQQTKRSSPPEH